MMNRWIREKYSAGRTIFSEGAPGQHAYLIEQGRIRITKQNRQGETELASLQAGDMFGEIALIDRRPRTASATALEETTLIPITRELLVDKLRQSDPLLSYILEVVVERWRQSMAGDSTPAPGAFSQEDGIPNLKQFAIDQLRIAQSLSDAIENDEFLLHYQPVVHMHDRSLAGFEALIRWNQPDKGFISPAGFIGVAENTGLIVPIGRWVLKTALDALAGFQACMDAHHPGHKPLFMSINVSARQLQEPDEVDGMLDLIRASGVNPGQVKLEVTESALIDNPDTAAQALHKLKSLGLLLAIDDFGTGYSSLSYLSQYPLDTLKIDQSFVFTMQAKEGSQRITKAIASMAHDLDMNCIAEGVEQESDIPLLQAMGVEYGQGYYFSKPRAPAQVDEYIAQRGAGI
ncbi:MAG: EAL domain-containing protein [Pseudomonadota bacterium]